MTERRPDKTLTLKPGQIFTVGLTRVRVSLTQRGRIRVAVWSDSQHIRLAKNGSQVDNSPSSFVRNE